MGTKYKGDKEDERTLNAFIKLMRAYDSIMRRLNKHLAEQGLTVSQFGVLEAIYHLGPLNQKSLGEKLLKSGGNMTLVIDNLERRDFVERRQDPSDRRSSMISLTPEGESFIDTFFPEHLRYIRAEFSSLNAEEKEQLGTICKKLGKKDDLA